jgi:hypothetical protein
MFSICHSRLTPNIHYNPISKTHLRIITIIQFFVEPIQRLVPGPDDTKTQRRKGVTHIDHGALIAAPETCM